MCHTGLVEVVTPILIGDRLGVVLFAGQHLPGDDLEAITDDERSPMAWGRRTRLRARGATCAATR